VLLVADAPLFPSLLHDLISAIQIKSNDPESPIPLRLQLLLKSPLCFLLL
jgi:hypothetical protein